MDGGREGFGGGGGGGWGGESQEAEGWVGGWATISCRKEERKKRQLWLKGG